MISGKKKIKRKLNTILKKEKYRFIELSQISSILCNEDR